MSEGRQSKLVPEDFDAARHKLMVEMSMPCVIGPILQDLEEKSSSNAAPLLREAFESVEKFYPGFSEYFITGILKKAKVGDKIELAEAILKLEGSGEQQDVKLRRHESAFKNLQHRSNNLKLILGRIPAEIADRKMFLDTIKDIAQAIKHLLDAVNEVFNHIHSLEDKNNLEKKKREFVKHSKRFSTTLKEFFKDNREEEEEDGRGAVYLSANHLIHQTNHILLAVA